uniref:Uncharacterized protein n=1 Tax=Setaria viridis TaxID=4556 RepID=A0A4U6VU13_SETVI|nr:hypothetical protein SEVIR_2G234300v2 [Setaria viridis]
MLKSQQRQGRYRLKKKYFDDLAANEVPTKTPMATMNDNQWNKLVTMWSSQLHRRKKKVEGDPTSIDLFKNFHCSKMATPLQYRQPLLGWNKLSPNLETTNQRLLLKQWLKLSNLGYFGRLLAFTHPRRKGLGLVLCCR